ncbi:MAG: autotransporter-associated beta strand repeat-containing protein [Verrucomicrobiales bacterium]|nr:autotransporter-associated beta strand repeat-containing protein [Verrucomicrobiales bacterium]
MCAIVLGLASAHAQRQMEKLGRGVVAVRTGTSSVYVGWRLLATDPPDTGFNLYRSTAGGPITRLNSQLLTNTTDFVDTTANLALSNAWFVQPVFAGVTQAMSAPACLPANAPTRQYLVVPLQGVIGGAYPPYDVKFCWVGDLDGDGEYDFVVDRLSTTANVPQYLQGYRRDGTLLFQVDLGFNSTNQYHIEPGSSAISTGHGDKVTVYDLDGDGRAEVLVCTANAVVFRNGAGAIVGSVSAANNNQQFISVLDGATGAEKARGTVPNPWLSDGPLNGWFFIAYLDGVRPSIVFYGANRRDDGAFQSIATAWDYRNGVLTQRWSRPYTAGGWGSDFHQVRIADLDGDGKDEISLGGFALDDDGSVLFNTELVHGDRHHTTDIDPDRPGLETFAIQQNNPALLGMALYEAGTGRMIKKWYAGGNVDVGRGVALDIDPRYRGVEMYAVGMGGIYNCKGERIHTSVPWPNEGLWWDADLVREHVRGVDENGYNIVIEKYNLDGGYTRLYSVYTEGARSAYGGRAAFWGDIIGDWREELVLKTTNYAELRIYTTVTPATNRLYCLMQNAAYRCQATAKGYYQASYTDYYLGHEMPPPPPPLASSAMLVWRGDAASNVWDYATANWRTNWFWSTNTTAPAVFSPGDTVLFDLTGSNSLPVGLVGDLAPGTVTVHSPRDYEFGGPGRLTGTMRLTKAGRGALVINTTNDYSGPTLVAEGLLVVNGRLDGTHVTVRGGPWLNGRVGGTGQVAGVTAEFGGGVSPGRGTNSPGVLTIAGDLTLRAGAINEFDLAVDPTAANDRVVVLGNVTVTGTNYFVINRLDTTLASGTVYPLVTYSGSLIGSIDNLVVLGLAGLPVLLTNPPGQIALVVKPYRPPATISWTGGDGGNVWDLVTTSNWLNNGAKDIFAPFDAVRFDAVGTSNLTVALVGALNPSSILVDSTANYVFSGTGSLIGACTLTKSNTGTLTINTRNNTFTGRTLIAGGTVVVPELGPVGFPSPLGNPPHWPTNLVLTGGVTLRVTGDSYTDRGMTIQAGTNTLDISSGQVTMAGQIVGSGTLQKLGAGTLALTASNGYTGGTIIKAGTVSLGGGNANQYALGAGTVTLDGGTLAMFSDSSTYDQIYWNLHVPSNSTGTLYADDRCDMRGSLTGAGTLNLYVYYVRTTLYGDWSQFSGQINVYTDSDGGDFRVSNSYGYGNASIYLGDRVNAYHVTSGSTVAVGALSGSPLAMLNSARWVVGSKNTDAIFAGSIYGNSITKVGTGTWTLTGNTNTYAGGTTITAGTLQIGNGGTTGSIGTGNITNNSTLVFNRSDYISDTNFGTISGTGRLVKRGAGRLVFTKAHTYTGPTSIEAGALVLSNAGSIANSSLIQISAGAALDVAGRAGGSMTLTAGKMLSGNGAVNGNFVVASGATLAPGSNAIGTLTFSNALVLEPGCTNLFEISREPLTNDHVRVIGTLTCGGTLVVTNVGEALSAGDTFKLFNAGSVAGSFTSVVLPPLAGALVWDTSVLHTAGVIKVVPLTPPLIRGVQLFGNMVVISGSGGVPGGTYTVLASTNVSLPVAEWVPIATNRFDDAGSFTVTNAVNPGESQRFYLLRVP